MLPRRLSLAIGYASWMASLLVLEPSIALATNPDVCKANGGTAECTGPEVTPYIYWSGTYPLTGGQFSSEAAAFAFVEAQAYSELNACTVNRENPAWLPLPGGSSSGHQDVGDPQAGHQATGDYWSIDWAMNMEWQQQKWTARLTGTKEANSVPPCASNYFSNVGMRRIRSIGCPLGWSSNAYTAPTDTWCYRDGGTVDVQKSLGPCKDCDLMVGHPANAATGNKYLEETDYRGSGPFPLEYTRRYNSQAWTTGAAPTTGPDFFVHAPTWRGTYDRAVLFSDSPLFPTVFVYRQDGRVLRFSQDGALWAPDGDVNEQLARLVDGGGATTGWTLTTESDELETYDATGRLIEIKSRGGIKQTLAYNAQGRLLTVTHSFGQQIVFGYDGNGQLQTVTIPGGGIITYVFGGYGGLQSVTYPDTRSRSFLYSFRALTGVIDEDASQFATYTYQSGSRVLASELAGGVDRYEFDFVSSTRTTVTDALGASRDYDYATIAGSTHGSAISQLCPSCGNVAKAKTFDAQGNVTSRKDFNNNVTCYAYDTSRNLETVRVEGFAPASTCPANLGTYSPAGGTRQRKITTQWHATFRLPTLITEATRETGFTYDSSGNLLTRTVTDTSVTPNIARTWTSTFNSFGRVLTINGPRTDVTDVTTYTYYSCTTGFQCGQIQTITDAASHVTTFNTYNAHGQPLTITDPNGVVSTLAYDARQRLTSRAVGGETTAFEYWPTGLLKKVTLPDTSFLLYAYDAAHRLIRIDDGAGNHINYTLNAMGSRTAESLYDPASALKRTHTRVFNNLNQLWKDLTAAGTVAQTTVFGYDPAGNQTTISAPLSRNSTHQFDELNRLKQVTDPAGGDTLFAYDATDNLIAVTDPRSKQTSYSYTGFDDLETQTSPDTGVTTNTFDSGGNLKTSTDARGAVTTYILDALNRVTSAAFKIGTTTDQTIAFSYDAGTYGKGRLTGASDANHSMSWVYNAQGRVTSNVQIVGAVTQTVSYGYTNGNLTSMTTPSGQSVAYGFNSNHQVTSVSINGTTLLSSVVYDPFGPVKGWTWGNATIATRSYDTDGKITEIASAGSRTYGYDDAFRITDITDPVTSANSWTYDFDLLDRLTGAAKTGSTSGWTYDSNGNRLSETGSSASSYTISSANNQVSSITGALGRTYSYDAAGNTLTYSNITATYNNRGRMATLTAGAVTASYVYNALGQRVKQSGGPAGTVLYMYDGAGHLLGEYDGSGNLIQETIWLGDIPVATIRPGTPALIFYVHADHLNTPRKVTRPSDNALRWTWESDAFGTTLPNENPASLGVFQYNLRFPGQIYDSLAGLNQNYFRDYDPAIGRYVESDPIGLSGGVNTYAYVESNPGRSFDPLGLARCTYSITNHTVVCDSNDLSRAAMIGPAGVLSGLEGECRNNPECADRPSIGPVPPGTYDMIPSDKYGGSWWLRQGFIGEMTCRLHLGRCEFFLHLGRGISQGCITIIRTNPVAKRQFEAVRAILRQDSTNTMEVVP